ncbi:SMC family protein [Achromobacter phage Motura]|uniref:SMC family protein n=1 Tax=Achromobacter phage Motura TaxID=2591403 RepID=A0A514CSF8_9CAUD|nr:SMC family protein [Achromobacter phage Motura]QDH83405.1 SMC family protein [Achromobacter phage Motura]
MSNLVCNHYDSLELEDCFPYRKVKLDIHPGITAVYGLNKVNPKSKNSNGAGKSYLFGQIFETQFHESLGGKNEDRIKRGQRTLHMTNYRGQKIKIAKGGSKIDVTADGVSQARTAPLAKKAIANLIPITAEDYEAYVFINCRLGHPLVSSGDSERKKFFTKFFQIDRIDEEKKRIGKLLRDLKSVRAAYKEAQRSYDELKSSLAEKKSKDELQEEYDELEQKLERLQRKQEARQDYERYTLFLESAQSHIKRLKKKCELTEEGLEQYQEFMRNQARDLKRDLEQAHEYQDYLRAAKKYKEAVSKIPADVYEAFKDAKLEKLERQHSKATELSDEIESKARKLERLDLEEPERVKNPKVDLGALHTEISKIEHQLKHAMKFGSGVCETCGQDVKTADPKKLKAKLLDYTEQVKKAKRYKQYVEDLQQYAEQQKSAIKLKSELKTLRLELKDVIKAANAYTHFRKLPEKPAKFNGEAVDAKDVQDKLDRVQDVLESIRFLQPSIDLLAKAPKEAPDYSKEIRKLTDRLSTLRADLEVVKTYRKKLKPLKERLAEYKEKLEAEADLKIIYEGYGDKAMKKMVVEQISALLIAQINKYAYVFPEKYTFEIVWDTKLRFLCHRKYGKRVETSDVRKLSGAESTLFSLILVKALLTFVPPQKRANVLILDEPSGSMHEETRQSTIDFLKILNAVIPSIVLITPKTEELYPNARAYTVIKESGRSRLVEGHPSTVSAA